MSVFKLILVMLVALVCVSGVGVSSVLVGAVGGFNGIGFKADIGTVTAVVLLVRCWWWYLYWHWC